MSESQFMIYMVCQWILAVGTIALAIVALWGHIIRSRWLGPRLCISLRSENGERSEFGDGVMSRYYHIRVFNRRRSAPAHNVRIVLKSLFRPMANGEMSPTALSGPLQMAWQFQGSNPQFQTIGAESVCDLGYLRQDSDFTLSMLYHHFSFTPTVSANQRIIATFVALSDETESNELRIEIAWDGLWNEDSDEMRQHLVVRAI